MQHLTERLIGEADVFECSVETGSAGERLGPVGREPFAVLGWKPWPKAWLTSASGWTVASTCSKRFGRLSRPISAA
jgi:hypothetical protein